MGLCLYILHKIGPREKFAKKNQDFLKDAQFI